MIRLSKSVVGDAEIKAVGEILRRGFLGMGTEVKAFEDDLRAYFGGDVGVTCVNTGTAALQLAIQALGLTRGDEVLVPTITYVASYQAIAATGARPVSCDVSPETGLIDLEDARLRLTSRTKAIMPVHFASEMGDLDGLYDFARRNELRVVEDAAHAFGCTYQGRKVGSFGDVVCFSFDGIKNITAGEGGAIVTRDAQVHSFVQDARLLGVEKDSEKRYNRERSWEFDVKSQGWRYHMSEIMAAIGRTQLSRFENEFKPKRQAIAKSYRSLLATVEGIRLFETAGDEIVPHILPIRVLNGKRDAVRDSLIKEDIQAGIHYKPNHLLTFFGDGSPRLPKAEQLYEELLSLPLHPDMHEHDDVGRIVSVIEKSL